MGAKTPERHFYDPYKLLSPRPHSYIWSYKHTGCECYEANIFEEPHQQGTYIYYFHNYIGNSNETLYMTFLSFKVSRQNRGRIDKHPGTTYSVSVELYRT